MTSAKRIGSFICVIIVAAALLWAATPVSLAMSAGSSAVAGILSGAVTRAPIVPVERPGAPSSAPAVGVSVVVTSPDGKEVASAVTDNEGKYSISLSPGSYRVYVSPGPMGRAGAPIGVVITEGVVTTQDLRINTRIR